MAHQKVLFHLWNDFSDWGGRHHAECIVDVVYYDNDFDIIDDDDGFVSPAHRFQMATMMLKVINMVMMMKMDH